MLFAVLFFQLFIGLSYGYQSLLHIGISLDTHTVHDGLALIQSTISSAMYPENLRFHIVACGSDLEKAAKFRASLLGDSNNVGVLRGFFGKLRNYSSLFEVRAFALPDGPFKQLVHAQNLQLKDKTINHAVSHIGTELVSHHSLRSCAVFWCPPALRKQRK